MSDPRAKLLVEPVDREAMAGAVATFLRAAGLDLDSNDLQDTPRRVADTWADEFLAGHHADPHEILAETSPATHNEPVLLSGISFVGVCPHHLLPYEGTARIAYVPGERVAGFGSLVRLVRALGARLILQEDLARDIAGILVSVLGAKGAGCVIGARHGCVGLRGVRQPEVHATTTAWAGELKDPESPSRRFMESSLSSSEQSSFDKRPSL